MASYYYLIASLPDLKTDGELPLSYSDFLTQCASNVDDETYRQLESLTLSGGEGPLVKEWSSFYEMLTKELGSQRSIALGKPYQNGFDKDGAISQVVSSAMSAKNPLEAEKILLDYEFETLDTLMGLHAFDEYCLFGYAIKLKLLTRQDCFDEEKGKAEFKSLFSEIQQRVYSL